MYARGLELGTGSTQKSYRFRYKAVETQLGVFNGEFKMAEKNAQKIAVEKRVLEAEKVVVSNILFNWQRKYGMDYVIVVRNGPGDIFAKAKVTSGSIDDLLPVMAEVTRKMRSSSDENLYGEYDNSPKVDRSYAAAVADHLRESTLQRDDRARRQENRERAAKQIAAERAGKAPEIVRWRIEDLLRILARDYQREDSSRVGAELLATNFSEKVFSYNSFHNDTQGITLPYESSSHSFVIIGGVYLVDFWAWKKDRISKPILHMEEDKTEIAKYGDPACWEVVEA